MRETDGAGVHMKATQAACPSPVLPSVGGLDLNPLVSAPVRLGACTCKRLCACGWSAFVFTSVCL